METPKDLIKTACLIGTIVRFLLNVPNDFDNFYMVDKFHDYSNGHKAIIMVYI